MHTISAADIPAKVQIIGLLGHPLGTVLDVRGTWTAPRAVYGGATKDASLHFRVTHINAKKLPTAIDFHRELIICLGTAMDKPAERESWEIRGFESGGMQGMPEQARKEFFAGRAVQEPAHLAGFRFTTKVEYLSVTKVERAER